MILPNTLKQANKAACPLNRPKLLTIKLFDPTDIPKIKSIAKTVNGMVFSVFRMSFKSRNK